ncbi:MAG TPA: XdhC/CoxI family protein [Pyrinomonadaceae bacterium]|jgi:xanthine dehydrogenase accessory factor|nr:XdhC/CoxI family protein [Pyrinomonadaceae bacterium]
MSLQEPPVNKPQFSSIPEAVSQTLEDGSIAALATVVSVGPGETASVGAKLLTRETGISGATFGSLGSEDLDRAVARQAARFLESKEATRTFRVKDFEPALTEWGEAQILFERIQAEPRVVICGAGHVGASLAKLASLMGYHATLIDDRAEFVTRDRFPEGHIELVIAQTWAESVQTAVENGSGVSVAIVTRGHSEDEQCLRAVIALDVDYVGLIGSKRRTNIVLHRLRESGADEHRLARVHAPVGLDIGAVTPEEVALAIMAEIVAVRRGGKGGSLSEWRRESK